MCDTCGCTQPDDAVKIATPKEMRNSQNSGNTFSAHSHHDDHKHSHDHSHDHSHPHDHSHDHSHPNGHSHSHQGGNHSHGSTISVETDILKNNNLLAERNRGFLEAKKISAFNLVSSPGSGKTSLLERTIAQLKTEKKIYVIEGDQQTMNDANRIDALGIPVVQVNTGNGCHLDSNMVNEAIKKLEMNENSILMIENVGNLVCPSLFDLGESRRIVIISVTEGEDKPVKYPNMFESSDICIINKIDLLPYVDFDVEKTKEYALKVNHHLKFFELSVKTGEGFDAWLDWLKKF